MWFVSSRRLDDNIWKSFKRCSLYPTDRLNSSVPVVPPTQKINSAAPQMNSNNTSPSHGSSNGSSDKKKDESDDIWGNLEAQASFLGPVLWDNAELKVGNFSIFKCFPSLCVCVFSSCLSCSTLLKFCLDYFKIYWCREGKEKRNNFKNGNVSMSCAELLHKILFFFCI